MTVVAVPEQLDRAEASRLLRLERTVERAMEVAGRIAGDALATIRDEKLYRASHSTFEAYLRERFGLARSTAYDMISAATAPQREVEGLSGARTNPQPSPVAEPRPPAPVERASSRSAPHAETLRCWAVVETGDRGTAVLRFEDDQPPVGARVLVAWTT